MNVFASKDFLKIGRFKIVMKIIRVILLSSISTFTYIISLLFCLFFIERFDIEMESLILIWFIVPMLSTELNVVLIKLIYKSHNFAFLTISSIITFAVGIIFCFIAYEPPKGGDFIPELTFLIFPPSVFILVVMNFICYTMIKSKLRNVGKI